MLESQSGAQKFTLLILHDRESEKTRWIVALKELHRIARKNLTTRNVSRLLALCLPCLLPFCLNGRPSDLMSRPFIYFVLFTFTRQPLHVHSLLTTFQLPPLRHYNTVNCCCVIDSTRLLIGCDDCLLCCDLDIQAFKRLTNSKKILAASYSHQDQLVVVLAGKQRHVKLIPTRGLDHENIEWIKVTETKGATCFVLVSLPSDTFICVAIKKTLLIYQVNRKKTRYTFWREVQMPLNIQTLTSHKNMIAVGTNSNFVVYHVNNREQPPLCKFQNASRCEAISMYAFSNSSPSSCSFSCSLLILISSLAVSPLLVDLVNQECSELSYLTQNSIDALDCQAVSDTEWVLVFARKSPVIRFTAFLPVLFSLSLSLSFLLSVILTFLFAFFSRSTFYFFTLTNLWILG